MRLPTSAAAGPTPAWSRSISAIASPASSAFFGWQSPCSGDLRAAGRRAVGEPVGEPDRRGGHVRPGHRDQVRAVHDPADVEPAEPGQPVGAAGPAACRVAIAEPSRPIAAASAGPASWPHSTPGIGCSTSTVRASRPAERDRRGDRRRRRSTAAIRAYRSDRSATSTVPGAYALA